MPTVEIEYCVPCDLLGKAQTVQEHVLEAFGQDLDALALVPGDGGIFEVRVDGEVVLDTDEEGYDREVLLERIQERVGAPAGADRHGVDGPGA